MQREIFELSLLMTCTVSYPFKEEKSAPFKKMETAKWKEIIPLLKAKGISTETLHRRMP